MRRKIWRLIFFTGVGALILGVVQNLPKAEVLEVDQFPDHVIQQEFESMERLLSGAWLISNNWSLLPLPMQWFFECDWTFETPEKILLDEL